MADKLTHLSEDGAARMVDVSAKPATARDGEDIAFLYRAGPDRLGGFGRHRDAPGGGRLARVAGIMAAKRTADLIPLCHPLPLSGVTLDLAVEADGVVATVTVRTTHNTGVEMEALTAVSVALLTVYDMAKALDRGMTIGAVRLIAKSGGRSGDWRAALEAGR
jgi:cyclic pyranopterin phosphate synthase